MTLDPAVAAVRLAVRRGLTIRGDGADGDWMPDHGPGRGVMVACSGGADSLALLAATVFETRRTDVPVIGAVVDHGLQEGSADHTARVVEQMAALGVSETASITVQVDPGPQGVEGGARHARYAALTQLAEHFGVGTILLGHTLDDQAETVLLGLARGSGGRSIAGMRPGFDMFLRPLLDITRAQTEQACRAEGIAWWDDPHNTDPRFLRSRVRHTLLPTLERELGPGVAETLARTGHQLRLDMEYLDDVARGTLKEQYGPDGFDVWRLEVIDWAILNRVLRLAALEAGAPASELFAVHVDALRGQVLNRSHLPKQIQLPGHVTAYREDRYLRFEGPATAVGR